MSKHTYLLKIIALFLPVFALACGADHSVSSEIEVPRMTVHNLRTRIDSGEQIVLVDVRSKEEFDEAHIPGAINVPANEINNRLAEFPKDRDIVFYCT